MSPFQAFPLWLIIAMLVAGVGTLALLLLLIGLERKDVKGWLKRLSKYLFVDPNSPEGLRFRATKLANKYGDDSPMVTALRKQADLKEEETTPK